MIRQSPLDFRRRPPRGWGATDLLIFVAVLVVVAALVLLRLANSRESARRMECERNLRSVFVGLESYSLRHGHFPIGTQNPTGPIRSQRSGYHHNWIEGILPMIDRQRLYDQIDFNYGVYADQNAAIADQPLPQLRCSASATTLAGNATTYAGVTASVETPIDRDNDGMFLLNEPLAPEDALDGQSFVLLVGEKAADVAAPTRWNSGTRASLRNTGHRLNSQPPELVDPLSVGGFSSNHPGGAYLMRVDGSFRFFVDSTDLTLLQQLAGRADGHSDPAPPEAADLEPLSTGEPSASEPSR